MNSTVAQHLRPRLYSAAQQFLDRHRRSRGIGDSLGTERLERGSHQVGDRGAVGGGGQSLDRFEYSIYRAFCQAKEIAQQNYRQGALKQHMGVVTPWFSSHFEQNRMLLGEDWWPYGLVANRKAVDTFLRYHYEQGLSKRLLTSEDIFVPALLDT
ncbi:hypothetical protein [Nocardia anaemiae]|uniref:hypothetical protein n=1 Tax=Nocardia anaemiae TaxID=263910 RepID=UPI001C3F71CC|nr:hypothetical protein [Nocardia anaemiae]